MKLSIILKDEYLILEFQGLDWVIQVDRCGIRVFLVRHKEYLAASSGGIWLWLATTSTWIYFIKSACLVRSDVRECRSLADEMP
jgi:hypothetical protein